MSRAKNYLKVLCFDEFFDASLAILLSEDVSMGE